MCKLFQFYFLFHIKEIINNYYWFIKIDKDLYINLRYYKIYDIYNHLI